MPRGASERQGAAQDAAAVVLQRGRCLLQVLVDLGGRQVQRTVGEPALDLLDTRQRLAPQFAETGNQLPSDERQGAADEAKEAQHGDGYGGAVGEAPGPEPPRMGLSNPASKAATITGMMRKLILLSSQTRAALTSRIRPSRHAQEAAIRTP